MTSFCSFFIFRSNVINLIHSICRTANWLTSDIPDPSMRYRFSIKGKFELTNPDALVNLRGLSEDEEYGRLLIFDTTQDEADNIIQLIWAAYITLEGYPNRHNLSNSAFPLPINDLECEETFQFIFRTNGYFQKFIHHEILPIAVAVAAKAWPDKKLVYAIHKLALSYQTESVTPWSMHPRKGQVFEKHTENFASHVGTSVAINLAFSAIQELKLDVQASGNKPRSTSQTVFSWNPEVLEPFKERLKKRGIDPTTTIDWITRGDETEVELYKMLNTPSIYADGITIRDRQISLPDAINFCEYLRNKLTAHSFSNTTTRLGPYEVYNTQQVARFLILSTCKMWNVRLEDLNTLYL